MKRLLLLLSILCLSSTILSARGIPIPIGTEQKLKVVYDLPDTEDYQDESGTNFDLARFHEEFNVLWFIPLWVTEDPKLVLMKQGVDDEYWDLDEEMIDNIVKENNLDKDELLSLGFWTRYGGKGIGLLFIIFAIWGMIPDNDDEEENVEAKEI